MAKILMPKATAVWLIDNTTLTFEQIDHRAGMGKIDAGIAQKQQRARLRWWWQRWSEAGQA